MGGDSPPPFLFEAVLQVAEQCECVCSFLLFASEEWIRTLSVTYSCRIAKLSSSFFEFHCCRESIGMGDDPLSAVRSRKDASMVVGIKFLKQHAIDAFVSAGNTGALIAAATLYLPKISGVSRLALLAVLPTKKGSVAIIDVGGNLSSKPAQLLQFASMGIAYRRCCHRDVVPAVGLLNIGVESKKGTRELQHVYTALQELSTQRYVGNEIFRFAGNVEGRDVFDGNIDVLITDGFTGNVFLKTVEGTAAFMLNLFASLFEHAATPQNQAAFASFQRDFSYTEYPGAILCGVGGVVVKCHGEASTRSVYHAIMGAISLVEKKFICEMKDALVQTDLLSHIIKIPRPF